MIQDAIQKVLDGRSLLRAEARAVMKEMVTGEAVPVQIASLLTALRIKGETTEELIGFAEELRHHATNVDLSVANAIDTCGTGGDGASTFNISTATAFVVAAVGIPVAKHGNRSVSSKSGSADVLEALGIPVEFDAQTAKTLLQKTDLCFLYAPLYHQALRHVMPTRKALGFRTFFNLLGPLVNPANITRQLVGVYDRRLTPTLAQVLKKLGAKRALVVSSHDGMDEITVTDTTQISELVDGQVHTYEIHPHQFGLSLATPKEITGGDAKYNAVIIQQIFQGQKGAPRDIVLLNAGAALYVAGYVDKIKEGVNLAAELIDRGAALEKLTQFTKMASEVQSHVSG